MVSSLRPRVLKYSYPTRPDVYKRQALCSLFGLASDGVYMCPLCYQRGGSLLHSQDIKEHIRELENLSPEVYDHLAAAMRNAPNQELWPAQLSQKPVSYTHLK